MSWSPEQKIAFRFFAIYFFLYCISNQFITSFLLKKIWVETVPWFGETILKIPTKIALKRTGSGDGLYNYVAILMFAILALFGTIFWSLLQRKKSNYNKSLSWLLILIKYYLIYQMLIYGCSKLFYLQFQPPHFARLIQPYGDSSPMGLLWTFMGFSKGYTMFTGAAELLGGIFLLFRRTRTLGALITFGVMLNVMAMNFFYDVPVKILSTHLVLLSLFLLIVDGKRLLKFFIFNTVVEPRIIQPLFSNPKVEMSKNFIKWFIIISGGFIYFQSLSIRINTPKPPLYGLYETKTFEKNGKELPPLTTDHNRWHRLIIDRKDQALLQFMTGEKRYVFFKPDTTALKIILNFEKGSPDTLKYSLPDSAHLLLEGTIKNDNVKIFMKSKKKEDFLLINRGFNWISEYPYNR